MGWRSEAPVVSDWVSAYVTRRYGRWSPMAQAAWALLLDGVYNQPNPDTSEFTQVACFACVRLVKLQRLLRARAHTNTPMCACQLATVNLAAASFVVTCLLVLSCPILPLTRSHPSTSNHIV
jgi:hypothetical protein